MKICTNKLIRKPLSLKTKTHNDTKTDSTCVIGSGGVVGRRFRIQMSLFSLWLPSPDVSCAGACLSHHLSRKSLSRYLSRNKSFSISSQKKSSSSSSSGLFPPTLGQKANHLWRSSGALEMTLSANYNDTLHSWAATATHLGIKYSQIVK